MSVGAEEICFHKQRRDIASDLVRRLLAHGQALGCSEAWVAADEDNGPARAWARGELRVS